MGRVPPITFLVVESDVKGVGVVSTRDNIIVVGVDVVVPVVDLTEVVVDDVG